MMDNPVQQFFGALANRDMEAMLDAFTEDAVIFIQGPDSVPIYNKFEGKEGVRNFIETLGNLIEQSEAFEVRKWMASDNIVFAYGYLRHKIRRTQKIFSSDWALICELENNKIKIYRMLEDTAALVEAYY